MNKALEAPEAPSKAPTSISLKRGFSIAPVGSQTHTVALLLWGTSGCGKTTLAATAPGTKLWINFDPGGLASVAHRDDILVLDLADAADNIVLDFKDDNPLGIADALKDHPEIETIVFDSISSFGDKALDYGVIDAKVKLEEPGWAGYGRKNAWTQRMVRTLLALSAKYDKHLIIIAHEDQPQKDKEGRIQFITMLLGSNLSEQVPFRFSEVWWLQDTGIGKGRRIAIRPCRGHKPMKTRMFETTKESEFMWNFDPDTLKGEGIATWYDRWKGNGYRKISLPS